MNPIPKYLPAPIYNFLPTLYVVAGSLIAAFHPVGLGKASSLLLIWVGVAVFNMRLNNRS